jgi:hypothetical protein
MMGRRNAARGRTRDVRHCDGARKPADGDRPARRPLVDDELADQLLGKAAAEGVELLGPDGLLSQVTKAVLERALAEEMTGHLGYDKHDPAGPGSGRWAWRYFAAQLGVLPEPAVPLSAIFIAVPSALVLANLIAAAPG